MGEERIVVVSQFRFHRQIEKQFNWTLVMEKHWRLENFLRRLWFIVSSAPVRVIQSLRNFPLDFCERENSLFCFTRLRDVHNSTTLDFPEIAIVKSFPLWFFSSSSSFCVFSLPPAATSFLFTIYRTDSNQLINLLPLDLHFLYVIPVHSSTFFSADCFLFLAFL